MACAWRCASLTLDTIWGSFYRRLQAALQESLSIVVFYSGTWWPLCKFYREFVSAALVSKPPRSSVLPNIGHAAPCALHSDPFDARRCRECFTAPLQALPILTRCNC
ncbi:unnamed protein product [Prorocentrum cordatum]|uniref:Secreted protein n=1 Tax=Prorocentrum cordatum TaxID=2364126 RepID=A0ABN9RDW2_9DINO|nr:unnamed protein product [Polarella glacialis]